MANLKTIILIGQSNMEGQATFDEAETADKIRWFVTGGGTTAAAATENVPGINYWKPRMPIDFSAASGGSDSYGTVTGGTATTLVDAGNTWVVNDYATKWVVFEKGALTAYVAEITSNTADELTFPANGFVPAAGDTYVIYETDPRTGLAGYTGKFEAMKYDYDVTALRYDDGYDYPSWVSQPRISPAMHSEYRTFGPGMELTWRMQQHLGETVWVIQLSIGGVTIGRRLWGPSNSSFGWYDKDAHVSFHPGSTHGVSADTNYGLYGVLMNTILPAAQTWLDSNRAGDVVDVQGIFLVAGESESADENMAAMAGTNLRELRDQLRADIKTGSYTSLSPKKIPFIASKVRTTDNYYEFAETVNSLWQAEANDDPYTELVDTDDLEDRGDDVHYDADSTVLLGKRLFDAWIEARRRGEDATKPLANRKTVSQLRDLVRLRYERNRVSNDATDERILMFLNDSQREIIGRLGDSSWFLIRTESFTLETGDEFTVELNRQVDRIFLIEWCGQKVEYRQLGYTDEGRIKIELYNGPGTYDVRFFANPPDLVGDEDVCCLPPEYIELLVLLTCRRLAHSGGNMEQMMGYAAEAATIWEPIWKQVQIQQPAKSGPMTVPGRRRMRRSGVLDDFLEY